MAWAKKQRMTFGSMMMSHDPGQSAEAAAAELQHRNEMMGERFKPAPAPAETSAAEAEPEDPAVGRVLAAMDRRDKAQKALRKQNVINVGLRAAASIAKVRDTLIGRRKKKAAY